MLAYDSAVENDIAQPQAYIASIDHALRLLLMLKAQPRIRVADAAEERGVARSTAPRVLGMLVYRGFAVQDPGSRAYRAGPVLVEVGMGALAQLDVRQRARPYLEHIASGGKAMLACMSDRALLALYPSEDLGPAVTAATITTRTALLAELATV